MENASDSYKTILEPSEEILFKEKKSKFYGYAFPFKHEDEVKPIVDALRKKHHIANHVCYAWKLGVENPRYRVNDDGEPNNSAGMPIYGQIQSFDVTDVLLTVVRIFGGTKLGVGGLIGAYKTAAQMAMEASKIVKLTLKDELKLQFGYPEMDRVMRVVKRHGLVIVSQEMELECELVISIRKRDTDKVKFAFNKINNIQIINT